MHLRSGVWKVGLVLWLLVISAAVGWLGWREWTSFSTGQAAQPIETVSDESLNDRLQTLSAQVASLSAQVSGLETGSDGLPQPSSSPIQAKTSPSSSTTGVGASTGREYFIPLGSGSTSNRDWTAMTGAQVEFDPSKYAPIKYLYFEASGSIISGEVHVLVTDLTHNRPYYEAVLVFNNSSPTWLTSPPIAVPPSPSVMQVQILSSNGELANLNDSRLVVETSF